jgi:hypothetical protein
MFAGDRCCPPHLWIPHNTHVVPLCTQTVPVSTWNSKTLFVMRTEVECSHPHIKMMDKQHTELFMSISLQFLNICLTFRRNPVQNLTENQLDWISTTHLACSWQFSSSLVKDMCLYRGVPWVSTGEWLFNFLKQAATDFSAVGNRFISPVFSCEIWGTHGSKYEDKSLVRYCTLMMEAVCTSETSFYSEPMQHNILEGCQLHKPFLFI